MADRLLLETGDFLLLEDGSSKLLLESSGAGSGNIISGALVEASDSAAIAAKVRIAGAASRTEANDSSAISAAVKISGSAAITEAPDSATILALTLGSAYFDGTGNNYLEIACPSELMSFPFAIAAHISLASDRTESDYSLSLCIWSAERTSSGGTNGVGTFGDVKKKCPQAARVNNASSAIAISDEATMPYPYWDSVTFEFLSTTDCRVYVNGVLEKQNTTSVTIDLSTGTPKLRIGRRGFNTDAFHGNIANIVCCAGTLSAGDRTLHATFGADYRTMTGAAHWWPLVSNGNDVIGTAHMSAVGTMVYQSTVYPKTIALPTRADYIQQVFKSSSLPSGTVTVTSGGSPPITVTTNLSGVEHLDGSFTGTDTAVGSPYTFRHWHYIPTSKVSPRHLVLVGGGHGFASDIIAAGLDVVIQTLVANGYDVLLSFLPFFDPQDPLYTGGYHDHNSFWARLSSTVNPLEKFHAPFIMSLNTIAGDYGKISITGLSGHGWLSPHQAALDTRINHAIVPVRGTIADRRYCGTGQDFEQWPEPNGWNAESIYYLAAASNRRLWLVHGPTDPAVGAKAKAGDHGAYLDATDYTSKFLAPISAAYPASDVRFYEDQDHPSDHFYTVDVINNALLPALAPFLTLSGALQEANDAASIAARVRVSGSAALGEASDSASALARVAVSGHVAANEANDTMAGHIGFGSPFVVDPNYLFVAPRRIRTITPRLRF